jgi:hypothetical protein
MSIESKEPAAVKRAVRPPWDTRAWQLAGISGIVISVMVAPSAFTQHFASGGIPFDLAMICMAITFLILPPIFAGIARRRWLLWPYLPCVMFVTAILTCFLIAAAHGLDPSASGGDDSSSDEHDMMVVLAVFAAAPFVTAFPVILIRWLTARQRRAAELLLKLNQQPPDVEGVWPPRPTNSD